MENEQMNQAPSMQQPAQTMTPTKKGHGALVTFIILLVLVLAALIFWGKSKDDMNQDGTEETVQQQQTEDFTALEAELEATTFEGVSDGL